MLTLRPFSRGIMAGGCCIQLAPESHHFYFHFALGFVTLLLAHMLDSLVRVSRRGKENHFTNNTSAYATHLGLPQDQTSQADTPRGGHLPASHMPRSTDRCWPSGKPQRPTRKRGRKYDKPMDWFPSLPLAQFQVLFNSLFKVLCIFPSRYLCTIGLPPNI